MVLNSDIVSFLFLLLLLSFKRFMIALCVYSGYLFHYMNFLMLFIWQFSLLGIFEKVIFSLTNNFAR